MIPGGRGGQPRCDRPFLIGGQALVPKQPDPRMIAGVPPRRGLQHLMADQRDGVPLHRRDDALEPAAAEMVNAAVKLGLIQ